MSELIVAIDFETHLIGPDSIFPTQFISPKRPFRINSIVDHLTDSPTLNERFALGFLTVVVLIIFAICFLIMTEYNIALLLSQT